MEFNKFKQLLLEAGLDKANFINLTGVPLSTYHEWAAKRRYKVPKWVEVYLKLYIKNRENEICIKKLKEELKSYDNTTK